MDFLICAKRTGEPLLAIELDDSSHLRQDRRERDMFINKAFADARMPLFRIQTQERYDVKNLKNKLYHEYGINFGIPETKRTYSVEGGIPCNNIDYVEKKKKDVL